MTSTPEPLDLDAAEKRMTDLSMKLAAKFGSLVAANLLLASAAALLTATGDKAATARYLEKFAREIENDPPAVGHA